MPSRTFIGSRTVTGFRTHEFPKPRAAEKPLIDRLGRIVNPMEAVLPDDPRSPFRDGAPYTDPEEQVVYRIVTNMNPLEGWASSEWWQRRLATTHAGLLKLIPRGLLDAALHEGSRAKRYRCRDEHTAREFLKTLAKKRMLSKGTTK